MLWKWKYIGPLSWTRHCLLSLGLTVWIQTLSVTVIAFNLVVLENWRKKIMPSQRCDTRPYAAQQRILPHFKKLLCDGPPHTDQSQRYILHGDMIRILSSFRIPHWYVPWSSSHSHEVQHPLRMMKSPGIMIHSSAGARILDGKRW